MPPQSDNLLCKSQLLGESKKRTTIRLLRWGGRGRRIDTTPLVIVRLGGFERRNRATPETSRGRGVKEHEKEYINKGSALDD